MNVSLIRDRYLELWVGQEWGQDPQTYREDWKSKGYIVRWRWLYGGSMSL